ncbi:ATP synthase F1 subunit gamma [Chloroflexota bacterium]
MISPRIIRRRIRSIQSTAKITRAMEMIATAKMKRAQEQAVTGRPYDEKITQLISHLAVESESTPLHPLLEKRGTINNICVIHITSDKGLCGGLNSNMNRMTSHFILQQDKPVTCIAIGIKGRDYIVRSHLNLKAEFTRISDRPTMFETLPISRIIIDEYTAGHTDLVYLAYNKFVSTMQQEPSIEPLLPVEPAVLDKTKTTEYIYEPDPKSVLDGLLPRYVEMKVYHAIREAIASEHSARMLAMRNATENANEIIEHLTLTLNKARQEMITTELLDITGGVEVLQ